MVTGSLPGEGASGSQKRPFRVLNLEDTLTDSLLIRHELERAGFSLVFERVETRLAFEKALQEFEPDIVLADFSLPSFDGLSALEIVRREYGRLPVIIVTGSLDEEIAAKCIKMGADDYVLKERLTSLPHAFRGALQAAGERTARQKAEKELQLRNAALTAAANGVLLADSDGRILWVNPAFTAMTGYTMEEAAGQNPRILKSGRHPDAFYRQLWETITHGGIWRGEIYNRRKDGSLYLEEMAITPFQSGEGTVTHFVAVKQDITDRKRGEQRVERLLRLVELGDSLDKRALLQRGMDELQELTNSRIGFLHFVSEDQNEIELVTWTTGTLKTYCNAVFDSHYPVSRAGIWADCVHTKAAIIVNDYATAAEKRGLPEGHAALQRFVSVPVLEGGRVRMIVGVGNADEDYDEGDVITISLYANDMFRMARRKEAQEMLRRSEAQLQKVLDESGDVVFLQDLQGSLLMYNRRFRELFLAGMGSALGRPVYDVFPRETSGRLREQGRRVLWERRLIETEEQIALDGRVQTYVIREFPLLGDDGQPYAVCGFARDITERKRAEDALRTAKARLEEAQALARIGSWERELTEDASVMSAEAFRVLGVDPSSYKGTLEELFAIIHPDDRETVEKFTVNSLERPGNYVIEHRILMPDGRVKWVSMRQRIEADETGKPVRVAGTIQDITEHRMALEAHNLARAKEAAEAANRAKSAFLASMSHEIRTPMNAILGFSQLLLAEPNLTGRQKGYLEAISNGGEHLLSVINDTLEISKIEAGRVTVTLGEVDVHKVIWDLESMFQLRARNRGLGLDVNLDADLPRQVMADERKLRQILINLMSNAVKFTERGGISLRVSAVRETDSTARLLVDVEDTGPGISGDELTRLFGQFEQTRTGRDAVEGTGLGLAISRGFARLMGGDLTVQSRPGEGSVFTLSLPVTVPVSRAMHTKERARRIVGLPAGEPRRRVLAVDDVSSNLRILSEMLGRVGFEVKTAADGPRAVDVFFEWRPHIVLMDLKMPGMDGLEIIRTIRRQETEGRVPIIAVTASAFHENRKDVEEAGGDGFLSKPFREGDLLETVGRCLGIEYVLEGAHEAAAESLPPGEAVMAAPPRIPEPLRKDLLSALAAADLERVLALADQLGTSDSGTARILRELAETFEYDRLMGILDRAAPGKSPH